MSWREVRTAAGDGVPLEVRLLAGGSAVASRRLLLVLSAGCWMPG
jgi:siroheme synthase (precorrin-2 oxidase/ferrochelatase)